MIPGELRGCRELKRMVIKNCKHFGYVGEKIKEYSHLKALTILDCPELKSLPNSINSCPSLTDVEVNGLARLPESIFARGKFKKLWAMNKSTMKEIPPSIDQLQQTFT